MMRLLGKEYETLSCSRGEMFESGDQQSGDGDGKAIYQTKREQLIPTQSALLASVLSVLQHAGLACAVDTS